MRKLCVCIGLLIADVCIEVPVAFVIAFSCGFMCSNPNFSPVWDFIGLASAVLLVLNILIVCGVLWLRWLFYIPLAIESFAVLVCLHDLVRDLLIFNADSIIPGIILFIGLVMCPCSIVLLALARKGVANVDAVDSGKFNGADEVCRRLGVPDSDEI